MKTSIYKNFLFDQIQQKLERLRKKLLSQAATVQELKQTDIFHFRDWPYVYTALGSPETGATHFEVASRTKIEPSTCQNILNQLVEFSIITQQANRYYPKNGHLVFSENIVEGAFKKFFLYTQALAQKAAEREFISTQKLFFNSVFNIKTSDLPALKNELRSVLLRFVHEHEDFSGDNLSTIVCSLF